MREDRETLRSLRQRGQPVVTYEMGQQKAKELRAKKYVECSALTQKGLKNVFEEAVRLLVATEDKKTNGRKLKERVRSSRPTSGLYGMKRKEKCVIL
jgi:GTPase SAR1 family protein